MAGRTCPGRPRNALPQSRESSNCPVEGREQVRELTPMEQLHLHGQLDARESGSFGVVCC